MAVKELKCPNCGAPLNYTGGDAPTITCPFCETVVVLPEELRPPKPVSVNVVSYSQSRTAVPQTPAKPWRKGCVAIIIIAVFLFIIAVTVIPIILSRQINLTAMTFSNNIKKTVLPEVFSTSTDYTLPSPTPQPTLTSTPGFANAVMAFGEKGIGPGLFNDARYIAVDGTGTIYVADYEGGRIQRFDSKGKYQSQWKVGDNKSFIFGITANHNGDVFVAFDDQIGHFDGKTGKQLGKMSVPGGGSFGDLAATADGHLAAMWYEGRYGFITSLDGHRDDLIIFDMDGNIILTIPSFISGQTDSLALDTYLAVDGTGTIYALSDSVIYQFSPQGKFLDKFGNSGDQPGQLETANTIAVDGQGRLYIGGGDKIHIYTREGQFVDSFPTGVYVDMIALDEQGNVWGVSRDQVTEYALRRQ